MSAGGSPSKGGLQTLQLRYRALGSCSASPVSVHFVCPTRNVSGIDVGYVMPNGQVTAPGVATQKAFKTGIYQVYP